MTGGWSKRGRLLYVWLRHRRAKRERLPNLSTDGKLNPVSEHTKAVILGGVFGLFALACGWYWYQSASLVIALRQRGVRAETWRVEMQTHRDPHTMPALRWKRGPVYHAEFAVNGRIYQVPDERIWYPKADLIYLPEDPSRNMIHYLEESVFRSVAFAGLVFFTLLCLASWTGALVTRRKARRGKRPAPG